MTHTLKNKKSKSISITLLVFMAFLLSIISLFMIIQSKSSYTVNADVINSVNSFYNEIKTFEFTLKALSMNALLKMPKPITQKNTLDFISAFQLYYENFLKSNTNIPNTYKEDYLKQIKDSSKYDITIKDNLFSFKLKSFVFKGTTSSEISMDDYTKDIQFQIPLTSLTKA